MSLGQNIRILRKKKGYSIMKVKELTGLSKSTISELETDKTSPTVETLQKIAKALELPVEELFKDQAFSHNSLDTPNNDFNFEKEAKAHDNKLVLPMAIIPLEFSNPEEARSYIKMHKMFSSDDFNPNNLSDVEILEFANALLEQMKMVSYKYKKNL